MTEACSPPPMYDSRFYQECYELVHNTLGVDLHKDTTHSNSLEVYKFLITSLYMWHYNTNYEFNLLFLHNNIIWMQTAEH